MSRYQSILITGASSGVGAALARLWAAPGRRLGLVARRAERLEDMATELRAQGAEVVCYGVDVCDEAAMAQAVRGFVEDARGLVLVVANAGISRSDKLPDGLAGPGAEVIAVNVQGVMHTLLPAIPAMIQAGGGHLVTIGSVAGFRGLPGKGAYCASKAAVKTLMDAYRPILKPHGILVSTICPGWFHSELTENNPYPMPFIMDTGRAARKIARAIEGGRKTYIFPWQMHIATWLMRVVPDFMMPNVYARRGKAGGQATGGRA